jgi:polar amino acid transport system permease protein
MRMLPPLASTIMSLIKSSALAAALGVTELTWQAGVLVQYNFRPIETFTVVALIYLAITFPLSLLVTYLQRRFQPRQALA